jgi:hypothetical protein
MHDVVGLWFMRWGINKNNKNWTSIQLLPHCITCVIRRDSTSLPSSPARQYKFPLYCPLHFPPYHWSLTWVVSESCTTITLSFLDESTSTLSLFKWHPPLLTTTSLVPGRNHVCKRTLSARPPKILKLTKASRQTQESNRCHHIVTCSGHSSRCWSQPRLLQRYCIARKAIAF